MLELAAPVPSRSRTLRAGLTLVLACMLAGTGIAQTPADRVESTDVQSNDRGKTTTTAIRDGRRIEQITVEDAGSRVDELREGGETRKITVQPKADVPAYDVRPPDSGAGSRRNDGSGNAGERSWKLFQF
ncbi:hypothetical protein [Comamonas serinivorans]|nr:hypothetical protein [Comamonas serinivorans]